MVSGESPHGERRVASGRLTPGGVDMADYAGVDGVSRALSAEI